MAKLFGLHPKYRWFESSQVHKSKIIMEITKEILKLARLASNHCLKCGPKSGKLKDLETMGSWVPRTDGPPEGIDSSKKGFVCMNCGATMWVYPGHEPTNILDSKK